MAKHLHSATPTEAKRPASATPAAAALVLAVALAALVWFVLRGFGCARSGTGSKQADPSTYSPSELVLSLSKSEFVVGEDGTATFAVHYAESPTSDITITTDDGTVLTSLTPDGSGEQMGTITLDTSDVSFPRLSAHAGKVSSAPVICRITPEVTDDMVATLVSVTTDLGNRVRTNHADDPYSQDTRDQLTSWLRDDPRVEDATTNGDYVLFRTTDGLVGGYAAAPREEGTLGFGHTIEEAWEANEAGQDVSDWTIPSGNVMTNSKVRYVTPIADSDATVGDFRTPCVEQLQRFATEMGYEFSANESDEEGLRQMCDARTLTDCGLLGLCTHGGHLSRASDNSRLALFCVRSWATDGVDALQLLEPFAEDGTLYYGLTEQPEANDALFCVEYDPDSQRFYFMTMMTSTKFMANIGLSSFDNTIIELLVCHGTSDTQLVQFLFDHGASAVIGCHDSYDCDIAIDALSRLTTTLSSTDDTGRPRTLGEVKDFEGYDEKATYREYHGDSEDGYDDYLERQAARPTRYFFGEAGRMTRGTAQVEGRVVGLAGETMPDVKVSACRWVDHDFQYHGDVTTDDDGAYTLPDHPFGLYYVEAEFMDAKAHKTATFEELHTKPEDLVLPIMTVTGRVVDKQTGDPLADQKVIISWGDYQMAGKTDATGTYVIHPVTCHEGGEYVATLASNTHTAQPIAFGCDALVEVVTLDDLLAEEGGDREMLLRHLFEKLVPAEELVPYDDHDASGTAGMDYFDYDPYYQALSGHIAGATIEDLDGDEHDEMLVASYDVRANEDPSNMYPDVHLLVRYFDVGEADGGRGVRLLESIDQIVSPTPRKGVFGAAITQDESTRRLVAFGTAYDDFSHANQYDVVWDIGGEGLALRLGYETVALGMEYAIDRQAPEGIERIFQRTNVDWEQKIQQLQETNASMYGELDALGAGKLLSSGHVDAAGMLELADIRYFALTELQSSGSGYVGRSHRLELDALESEWQELKSGQEG